MVRLTFVSFFHSLYHPHFLTRFSLLRQQKGNKCHKSDSQVSTAPRDWKSRVQERKKSYRTHAENSQHCTFKQIYYRCGCFDIGFPIESNPLHILLLFNVLATLLNCLKHSFYSYIRDWFHVGAIRMQSTCRRREEKRCVFKFSW